MDERTPIDQAADRILDRPLGIKSIISFSAEAKPSLRDRQQARA